MAVSLLDLKPQHRACEEELKAVFERILRSGQYILGAEVERFERSVAERVGVAEAIGVSSGTDALLVALMALGIGPGDEVICPTFTFFATAGSIARTGAVPVFADSCPTCFNLDADDVRNRVTSRTKAIVPVHLFGQAADMDSLMAVAHENGLAVVEDAAQALGAKYKGTDVGRFGDFAALSFFPTKNLGGLGDGGMLLTGDSELAEKARMLRNHGSHQRYRHRYVGGNFRLDALQAGFLSVKLERLDAYNNRRRAIADAYREKLGKVSGIRSTGGDACGCSPGAGAEPRMVSGTREIVLPFACAHNHHTWNQFTLRVKGPSGMRDELRAFLAGRGIASEIYYPVPMHRQECFESLESGDVPARPQAEQLADECLSLPIFPDMTGGQIDEVTDTIAAFMKST